MQGRGHPAPTLHVETPSLMPNPCTGATMPTGTANVSANYPRRSCHLEQRPRECISRLPPSVMLALMIPVVRLADAEYHGRARSAFGRAGPPRQLDVWLDVATLTPSADLRHLLGFATHDKLRFIATRPVNGAETAELVVGNGYAGARLDDPTGATWLGGAPVATYERLLAHWIPDLSDPERDRVLASTLLATVADIRRADVLVTGNPVRDRMNESNGMGVREALAVIGLFLRSNDDFTVSLDPSLSYSRGPFYWRTWIAGRDRSIWVNGRSSGLGLR
jgi:hypothetical protein